VKMDWICWSERKRKKTLAVLDFSDPFDVVRGVRPQRDPDMLELDFVISMN